MTTKFNDFVREVEGQSTTEERRQLAAARARFRLGARILQQRLAAGLTQGQLAAAAIRRPRLCKRSPVRSELRSTSCPTTTLAR
jgi:hypothetical protein